jgi:PIN domain nuclease of toxin-antitoxin system
VTALFDTHALLWAMISPRHLSGRVAQVVEDRGNELLVSAATAWEIATKVRLGKLPLAERLESDFERHMRRAGYRLLPIAGSTALRSGRLPGAHGDPFDRMIAAQALDLGVPVLSADAQLDQFGIQRLW